MSLVTCTKVFFVALVSLMGTIALSTPGAGAVSVFHGAPMQLNPHPAGAATLPANTVSSNNWSGYAATGSKFASVSSSWVQPSVSCNSTKTYSADWVGLDGYGNTTVEQTGSLAECKGGGPQYSAWYETYPNPPVYFPNAVTPGHHMKASVTATSATSFTMTISDTTAGWSRSVTRTVSGAQRSSAEVIVEAPSGSGGTLPLANFHTVSFNWAKVNGNAIGTYNPTKIVMASGSTTKDSVSALTKNKNFSVAWLHS
jgi:Peptidase A4 family